MSAKQISTWRKALRVAISVLALGVSMNADAGFLGIGGDSWKEEALLHDGSKIIVTRTVERGGRREIGQVPPIKEQSLTFTMPGTNKSVTWKDHHSEDVGGANFNLKLLDLFDGTPYVLAMPSGCQSYNKWGRPNPPYVVFKYDGNEWQRIPLNALPDQIKTPNLIPSSPDSEAKKTGQSIVSAETIRAMYESYSQLEFKTILREAISRERCPQYSSGPKPPLPITPSTSTK